MILSWMKRLMILKQHDLMIYRCMIKSRQVRIKHQHSPNYQMQCQPMVFIILTEVIIIQIRIKWIRLHRLLLQHPVIYQQMHTLWIIIQELIDIGPDFRTQLTKGETFLQIYTRKNKMLYFKCIILVGPSVFCVVFFFGLTDTNLYTSRSF